MAGYPPTGYQQGMNYDNSAAGQFKECPQCRHLFGPNSIPRCNSLKPAQTHCYQCNSQQVTMTEAKQSTVGYLTMILGAILCPCTCVCIAPCLMDEFKNVSHKCPSCQAVIYPRRN